MKDLIAISSYPRKGKIHGKETVGVASYTKNLLLSVVNQYQISNIPLRQSFSEASKYQISVLAEMFGSKSEKYKEEGIGIERTWERNNVSSILRVFFSVLTRKEKKVLISFEINMFGGFLSNLLFLLFLPFISFRKKIYIVVHQSILTFEGLESSKIKVRLKDSLKNLLYFHLSLFSHKIIVFEKALSANFPEEKVVVIPHAVESFNNFILSEAKNLKQKTMRSFGLRPQDDKEKKPQDDKEKARELLGLDKDAFYLLYFGFISPYKGVDALINKFKIQNSKFKINKMGLIIAGGINPNHAKNKMFVEYEKEIKISAKEKGILYTGFVKEEEIPLYFLASDCVVLPYKSFFASSGPLSLAFSFERPVLLSKKLEDYFQTGDFQAALKKTSLKKEDFLFDFDQQNLFEKLNDIKKDKNRFISFSRIMRDNRSWQEIGKMYTEVFEN